VQVEEEGCLGRKTFLLKILQLLEEGWISRKSLRPEGSPSS